MKKYSVTDIWEWRRVVYVKRLLFKSILTPNINGNLDNKECFVMVKADTDFKNFWHTLIDI